MRALTQEFLLRVSVPEFDTKFALKVLPSLQISDLTAMIMTSLRQRRISIRQSTDKRKLLYGVYLSAQNRWIDETAGDCQLQDYGLRCNGDEVQFKIKEQFITITLPSGVRTKYRKTRDFTRDSLSTERCVLLPTRQETQVIDLLRLLNAENENFSRYSQRMQAVTNGKEQQQLYGIYSRSGERLSDDSSVWTVLRESSELVL